VKAVVTGGGGFLGAAIARQLIERGDEVVVLGRNRYPEMEALGCIGQVADLSKGAPELPEGVDVVFHVAALAGMWGAYERYFAANVQGTRNILQAARARGVKRFVLTSTPSVAFGGEDVEGANEAESPYPSEYAFHYAATKAIAEQEVLAANANDFATTALRPQLIYGPGDPHLLPRLLSRQKAGRLRVIGDGKNKVSVTFVENGAVAHLQAADALHPGSKNAGKAYFITDLGDPIVCWDWLGACFEQIGLGPIKGQISRSTALKLAAVVEWVWRTFRLSGDPPATRFSVEGVSSHRWYDVSAAVEDFGYAPLVSGEEGFARMVEALKSSLSA
jgi:2-alkyl-3-oxoalkanoate reductase